MDHLKLINQNYRLRNEIKRYSIHFSTSKERSAELESTLEEIINIFLKTMENMEVQIQEIQKTPIMKGI